MGRPKLRQELVNSDRKRMNFWELACSYGGHCLTVCQAIVILRGWFWVSNVAKGLIAVEAHHAGFCLWLKRKTSLWVRRSLAKRWCWSSLTPLVREASSLNTQRDEAAIQPGNPSPVFSRHGVFPSKSHWVVPGMLCLQVQFPWRSPLWTWWIYSHGQPWIAGLFQSFRELCTTPERPFLGRNWNLGHLNALQSITHKLPPNPTSCVFPKDATAKGCGAPWDSSPPREEQGRADLAF